MIDHPILRKPWFWSLFVLLSLTGIGLAYYFFPKVFPLIHLDLQMNRSMAIKEAEKLAQEFNWGPHEYQNAISFNLAQQTKNFIELEGGGKEELVRIIDEEVYSPYTWKVRHFKEHDENEVYIYFTPSGRLYGFNEILSEDEPGKALTQGEAQTIAEKNMHDQWHISLSDYSLVEHSEKKQPSERIDHTFEYEHVNKKAGEAPYRLCVRVSGDKVTHFYSYIKVPEGFQRRYEHMRSFNNTLAQIATLLMLILYLFGCGFLGIIFLLRRRWLIWKPALYIGIFIATLQMLDQFNQLPLAWMSYNTALGSYNFLFQFIVNQIILWFVYTLAFSFCLSAAESLTRQAFPHIVQFWKSFTSGAAQSWEITRQTLIGYLMIGLDLSYVVIFYFIATRLLGWWNPSESLIDPNVLASYMPWFTSISRSFQAGFIEECVFRALPLAAAALIGKRLDRQRLWIIGAFILQALIFGAAHANYPAQPFYARMIELVIPSFIFGGLYLSFGLIPAILSHYVYDVFWFALPIFISDAPNVIYQQIIIIILALLPLLYLIGTRLMSKGWTTLTSNYLNQAWGPSEESFIDTKEDKSIELSARFIRTPIIIALGVLGEIGIGFLGKFTSDALPLSISRKDAIETVQKKMAEEGITLSDSWSTLSTVRASVDEQDRFIWEKGYKKTYKKLLGHYLDPAYWSIRNAQFFGDLIERAEEFYHVVAGNGTILRHQHKFPEERPGKILEKEDARKIVRNLLEKKFNVALDNLEEVSAESKKHPNRLDWTFTFKDKTYPLDVGEARIYMSLAGDQLSSMYKDIFVPDKWRREFKDTQTFLYNFGLIIKLLLFIFLFYAAFIIMRTRRIEFSLSSALIFAILMGLKSLIQTWNLWPVFTFSFSTSKPYYTQIFSSLSFTLLGSFFFALFIGFLAGYIQKAKFMTHTFLSLRYKMLISLCLALSYGGVVALLNYFEPSIKPYWPDYSHAAAHIPAISMALSILSSFIITTLFLLLLFTALGYITHSWHKRYLFGMLFTIGFGMSISGLEGIEHLIFWLIENFIISIVLLILYILAFRFNRALIPLTFAYIFIGIAWHHALLHAFPQAIIGAGLTTITLLSFALWWSRLLEQKCS